MDQDFEIIPIPGDEPKIRIQRKTYEIDSRLLTGFIIYETIGECLVDPSVLLRILDLKI